jgi:diaminopimelate decarboxylase
MVINVVQEYGTPLWIYDAAIIRARIAQLKAFDVIRFAQKANSNTHILRLMRGAGVKVDAVSMGEVERALVAGYTQDDIVFTADVMDRETLDFLVTKNITVNAGSIDMLTQLGTLHRGHHVWIRINPGFGHGHSPKTNTGGENSKHGIWHGDVARALAVIKEYGLDLVGVHMHIGSGVDYGHLELVCDAMVSLIKREGIDVGAISAGGGLSVPYRAGEEPIDPAHYFTIWDRARKTLERHLGHNIMLEIEPGRYLVAESGQLVTEVRAVKDMGHLHYVLVDAGFTELVRPAMYGSYHAITALPPREGALIPTVVAGPLCESGDVFTQEDGGVVVARDLPPLTVGDYLVFHTTGAYGASMSSNYNSRPYCAEVMVDGDVVKCIRRRQRMDELLALEDV